MITKQNTAAKLADYLHHEITLSDLVDWAETAMMDGDFEDGCEAELAEIIGRLGLADVRAFGLTCDECEEVLRRLGYEAHIEIAAAK